jgi:agmatine deiminase
MTTSPNHDYRLPAEWEPHAATWLAWPKNPADWPGKFHPIGWVFGEIIRKLTPYEKVRLIVDDEAWEARARRVLVKAGVDMARVRFYRIPTDRGWCRDMLPAFTVRGTSPGARPDATGALASTPSASSSGARAATSGASSPGGSQAKPLAEREPRARAVRFGFTGWAKYANHTLDAAASGEVARRLKMPCVDMEHGGRLVVLEGGGIDCNGRGALLTTEECFLDPVTQVRNPGMSAKDYEAAFKAHLGVDQVIWLGKGIAGDDTHGHVDDLCRFVSPGTVVLCREHDPSDENYRPLEENRERLEGARLADGSKLQVIGLPMPEPLYFDGVRLPASYANFYIANGTVLVPTFNDARDRVALGVLAECFPDRAVVGVHAVDLVWGFGTLHCLTHEQPATS